MTAAAKDMEAAKRRTGFEALDKAQVFAPGIYIIGAPPSAGKSTFCLQLANKMADQGEEVLFLSYEMSVQALCRKLISRKLFEKKKSGEDVTKLAAVDIRRAGTGNDDVNAVVTELADSLNHLRLWNVGWESSTLVKELRSFASSLERPPVIFVDYLQMIQDSKAATPRERIDSLLSALREFQNDTDATIFLVSAFNRANNQQSETSFSSFKESGAIEYAADCLWALEPAIQNGESVAEADKRERKNKVRAMRLRCLKNREGSLYACYFRYYAEFDTFEEATEETVFKEAEQQTRRYSK